MRSKKLMVFCMVVASLAVASMATMKDDENACAEQMANLAACIPFVSGTEKKPTPECCENTKQVKANKPECLCVLIKESNDPSVGLPVNTTLALQMPSACNIDGKVSDCPSILNMPPHSPDAKIFKEADSNFTTDGHDHQSLPTTDGPDHRSPPTSASTSSSSSVSTSPSSSSGSESNPSDSKATPSCGATLMKLTETTSLLLMMVSMALMLN